MKKGKVYLLGAGPGDATLLTMKGYRCLQEADVVVYDFLACPSMLNVVRPECELIFAGKQAGHHFKKQHEINLLLAELAEQGKIVVRLKGGDPYIFGRGGEEAQVLLEYGVSFEVIPGVSSCYSVPSYAGIPVTHRAYASSFHVITGHKQLDRQLDVHFEALAKLDGTLVFLMSLMNLPHIVGELIAHGKRMDTPAAVIQKGTTTHQKTAVGTLATIVEEVKRQQIHTPALTVVGDVVSLRSQLNWFEQGALFGKKVIATGTPAHTSQLSAHLRQYGAETAEISLIYCKTPKQNPLLQVDWCAFSWLVFTSVNGVVLFWEALRQSKTDLRKLMHLKFAAIGSGTAKALAEQGISVDCVPERFESRYLAEALIPQLSAKDRVLLMRAENGTIVLPELLQKAGKTCVSVPLYRTEADVRKKELLQLHLPDADYLVFASASAVRAYAQMRDSSVPCHAKVISIGAVTSGVAEECGIPVAYTAEEATVSGITAAILKDATGRE